MCMEIGLCLIHLRGPLDWWHETVFFVIIGNFSKPTGLSFDISPYLKERFGLHKGISSWLIGIAKLPSITYKYWGEVQVLRNKNHWFVTLTFLHQNHTFSVRCVRDVCSRKVVSGDTDGNTSAIFHFLQTIPYSVTLFNLRLEIEI